MDYGEMTKMLFVLRSYFSRITEQKAENDP